jgi:hypothetical protein
VNPTSSCGVCALPDDVLLVIFSEFREPIDVRSWENWLCATTISHVCREWRVLIISTPTFWTKIRLMSSQFRRAKAYIKRSKGCPLNVFVPCDGHFKNEEEGVDLMILVQASVLRWRTVCFETASRRWMEFLIAIMPPKVKWVHNIESLELIQHGPSPTTHEKYPRLHALLKEHPPLALKNLRIRRVAFPWTTLQGIKSLTCLDIRHLATELPYLTFRDVLLMSQGLQQLLIRDVALIIENDADYPTTIIPSLQSLEISSFDCFSTARLCSLLSTPKLRSLFVSDIGELSSFTKECLQTSLPKYPAVTSLKISDVSLGDRIPEEFYTSFPMLKHFILLEWSGWYDDIFGRLNTNGADPLTCPDVQPQQLPLAWPQLEGITLNIPLWPPGENSLTRAIASRVAAIGIEIKYSEEGVEEDSDSSDEEYDDDT